VTEPQERDPFAEVRVSPRFATPLAVVAFVLAAASLITGLAPLTGPAGMAFGIVAHLKGSRLGMPAAVASGIAMIVGFVVLLYLR
jgi:lipopolysaccharide export LptBFGC system permease protein LptF